MMGSPQAVNTIADAVNNAILKSEDVAEKTVDTLAEGYLVWLKWPVIKQLFEMFVAWVGSQYAKEMAAGATKLVIDVQVNGEESAAKAALAKLQAAEAKGDANAIARASDDFDKAYADLLHYDCSASAVH